MTELVPTTDHTPASPEELAEAARDYARASRAAATRRGYLSDWRQFAAWCERQGVPALPATPATVALYVADLAGRRAVATIQRHLTSISVVHATEGHPSPTKTEEVRQVWSGVKRTYGTANRKKEALTTTDIRAMLGHLRPDHPKDIRDRALVLIGFAGALRRSELVALDVDDIDVTEDGLRVNLRRSKTDQTGEGHQLGLPFGSDPATCPVRAYRRHIEVNGIETGALFRGMRDGKTAGKRLSGKAAAARVKRLAKLIGKDPAEVAGHSLRRGLITSAVKAGVPEHDIMRHSRHRSIGVFRGYVQEAEVFTDNAASAVGL